MFLETETGLKIKFKISRSGYVLLQIEHETYAITATDAGGLSTMLSVAKNRAQKQIYSAGSTIPPATKKGDENG